MLRYYAFIQDDKIIGSGNEIVTGGGIICIEITEEVYNSLDRYIWDGESVILDPDYDNKQLERAKQLKYDLSLALAYEYQQNGIVEYKNCEFEMSDSNRKNLSDTEEALKLMGQESTIWNDKEDNLVELTVEDIQYIRLNLILSEIQKLWIVKYPYYKGLIEAAKTVEEVESIVIDYSQDIPKEEADEETPIEIVE